MIQFSRYDGRVVSRLEAEGTDHWRLDLDRIPSYNSAQGLLSSALTSLLEAKKFSGESLRDLNKTVAVQTSVSGRVELDRLLLQTPPNHKVWSVIAVYPQFVPMEPAVINPDPLPNNSMLRLDVRMDYPLKTATRSTQQQRSLLRNDPFMPGNGVLKNTLKEWTYFYANKQVVSTGQQVDAELAIADTDGQRILAAISYLKVPDDIPVMVTEQDPLYSTYQLEWPDSMMELLIAISLRVMTYRQGDGTTVNSLSTEEMSMLMQAIA